MARIRSIHPGLFTDEAWVSCSPLARVLVIGLWTDADDQGVFEWKPLQIKMRLLPGDAADVSALLTEIQDAGMVMAFEAGGKRYGAIRNFRKFQRPQKPNALHPLPELAATYVGLSPTGTGPVQDPSEIAPVEAQQMEDGGGVREEEEGLEAIASCAAAEAATGDGEGKPKSAKAPPAPWLKDPDFCTAWDTCTPAMRKRSESREKTFAHWKRQAAIAGSAGNLLHALRRYIKGDPDVKRTGGPGFHLWLKDGTWDHWTETASAAPITKAVWIGPPEIRNAVIREINEEFASSYLDTCAWLDGSLVPRTHYAADKLKRLRALRNVVILEPQGAAA
jgi:hypothetical protein